MTINAPAAMLLAFYICVAEKQGVPQRQAPRHDPDGHPQGVHRAEGVDLPARALDAALRGHDRVCAREVPLWHPVSISGYHIREAGSTAAQELAFTLADGFAYVEAGDRARARRRRLRAAPLVLLQRAHRLLRGDRQVPRRPAHLGQGAARALRREEPALVAHALPRADRGRLADGAAARGEHRPHGARGAGRRARRVPVAPHELLRRGACAPDRARREDRAAHAADDRPRDRRRPTIDPLGGSYFVEDLTNRLEAGGLRLLRPDPDARRRRPGDQGELLPARDRRGVLPLPERGRVAASASSSASTATRIRRARARDPPHRRRARAEADRARAGPARAARLGRGRVGARPAQADAADADSNLMPAIIDASRAYVTMGEMCDALRESGASGARPRSSRRNRVSQGTRHRARCSRGHPPRKVGGLRRACLLRTTHRARSRRAAGQLARDASGRDLAGVDDGRAPPGEPPSTTTRASSEAARRRCAGSSPRRRPPFAHYWSVCLGRWPASRRCRPAPDRDSPRPERGDDDRVGPARPQLRHRQRPARAPRGDPGPLG